MHYCINFIEVNKGYIKIMCRYGSDRSSSKAKKALKRLFIESNKCCYCGRFTYLPPIRPKKMSSMATLEHVYSRSDIRRALEGQVKLACQKCNCLKGAAYQELVYADYKSFSHNYEAQKIPTQYVNLLRTLYKNSNQVQGIIKIK